MNLECRGVLCRTWEENVSITRMEPYDGVWMLKKLSCLFLTVGISEWISQKLHKSREVGKNYELQRFKLGQFFMSYKVASLFCL